MPRCFSDISHCHGAPVRFENHPVHCAPRLIRSTIPLLLRREIPINCRRLAVRFCWKSFGSWRRLFMKLNGLIAMRLIQICDEGQNVSGHFANVLPFRRIWLFLRLVRTLRFGNWLKEQMGTEKDQLSLILSYQSLSLGHAHGYCRQLEMLVQRSVLSVGRRSGGGLDLIRQAILVRCHAHCHVYSHAGSYTSPLFGPPP